MKTKTSTFGVAKCEGHNASDFYSRQLFENLSEPLKILKHVKEVVEKKEQPAEFSGMKEDWQDKIYCQSSESMWQIPNNRVLQACMGKSESNTAGTTKGRCTAAIITSF